jgi:hypothetical protein
LALQKYWRTHHLHSDLHLWVFPYIFLDALFTTRYTCGCWIDLASRLKKSRY